jgi:hypothetical protein
MAYGEVLSEEEKDERILKEYTKTTGKRFGKYAQKSLKISPSNIDPEIIA